MIKKLIILDLMGTLIEAGHLVNNQYVRKREYYSRILYITRKLNSLLEKGFNIVILSSIDHSTVSDEMRIISDIDDNINFRDKISYFLAKEGCTQYNTDGLYTNNNKYVKVFNKKNDAYKEILSNFKGYQVIAVDDNPDLNEGFFLVYNAYGKLCMIDNFFNSRDLGYRGFEIYKERRYPYISNEVALKKYIQYMNYTGFDLKNVYEQYLKGELDIKQISFQLPRDRMKKYFNNHNISTEEFNLAIKYEIITFNSSFEEVYQKVLKKL